MLEDVPLETRREIMYKRDNAPLHSNIIIIMVVGLVENAKF